MSEVANTGKALLACPLVWLAAGGLVAMGVLACLTVPRLRKPVLGVLAALAVLAVMVPLISVTPPCGPHPYYPGKEAGYRLERIGVAVAHYFGSDDDRFPTSLGQLWSYVDDKGVFVIPGAGTPEPASGADVDGGGCDFLYFGEGLEVCCEDAGETVVATTTPRFLKGPKGYVGVLYADFGVRVYTTVPADVQALWDEHGIRID
jgi:hypothetical protein